MGLYEATLAGSVLGGFWPVVGAVGYTINIKPAPFNPDAERTVYSCFRKGYLRPRVGYALLGGAVGMAVVFGVSSIVATQVYGVW
jgi:hypothetical protein